jgi:hypothetical protein
MAMSTRFGRSLIRSPARSRGRGPSGSFGLAVIGATGAPGPPGRPAGATSAASFGRRTVVPIREQQPHQSPPDRPGSAGGKARCRKSSPAAAENGAGWLLSIAAARWAEPPVLDERLRRSRCSTFVVRRTLQDRMHGGGRNALDRADEEKSTGLFGGGPPSSVAAPAAGNPPDAVRQKRARDDQEDRGPVIVAERSNTKSQSMTVTSFEAW